MADFTAADVKKLRELTGAGMMDCKNALVDNEGDFDKAIEALRIKGQAKAAKRADERTASNGLVAAAENAMIELNCETDFVAKNEQFQQLAADIVAHAASAGVGERDALLDEKLADGRTVRESIDAVAAVIGEKLELGQVVRFPGKVAAYMHRRSPDLPPQVGVLVEFTGDDAAAARGAAMQVAAMKAQYVSREAVPAEILESERRIAEAKAREDGKPEAAISRIVEGTIVGFYKSVVLGEQDSVQDSKKKVQALLDEAGVTVTAFARFSIGGA